MAAQVGAAFITVRPSFAGFHKEITKNLRSLGPQVVKIGQELGAEFRKGFTGGVGDPVGDPLDESTQRQKKKAPRKGDQVGGAFARGFQKRLKAAFANLPDAELDADATPADKKIAELRARMEALSEKTIGVDVDAGAALDEMAVLKTELETLGRDASIDVRADVGATVSQLVAVQALVTKLSGETVEVEVDVSTDKSRRGLLSFRGLLTGLGPVIGGVGSSFASFGVQSMSVFGGVAAAAGQISIAILAVGAVAGGVFAGMGAAIAGVGAGFIGLGVLIAAQNSQVKQAFSSMATDIKKQAAGLAQPFVGPLKQVAGILQSTFTAIAPALRQIFATLAPTLVPLVSAVAGLVRSLMPLFQQMAAVAAPMLRSLAGALQGLAGNLTAFFTPILAALRDVGQQLFPTLISGVGGLLAAFGPLLGVLVRVGAQLLGPLLSALTTIVQAVGAALAPVLRALAPIFVQLVGAIAPLVAQIAAGLSPILVALAPIFGQLLAVLQPVISSLVGALQPVIAALVPVVGLLVGALGKIVLAVVPLLAPLGQLIASLVSGLMPILTPIIGAIVQVAQVMIGALVQAITASLPSIQQIVLAVASLLPALLPLVPLWGQMAQAILPVVPPLARLIATLVTALVPVLRLVIAVIVKIVTTVAGIFIPAFRLVATVIAFVANLLVPIIHGIVVAVRAIGTAAMFVWGIIKVAFAGIMLAGRVLFAVFATLIIAPLLVAFNLLKAAVLGLWRYAIAPAFRGIAAVVTAVYNGWIKPQLNAFRAVIRTVGAAMSWLWHTIVVPVWNGIAAAIRAVYNATIRPILSALNSVIRGVIAPTFRWIYNSVIRPMWSAAGSVVRSVWNNVIRPAFNALKAGLSAVRNAFRTAVSAIGRIWKGIESATRRPVKFVIDVVYNNGIRKVWNTVAGLVKLPQLPAVKFAAGGVFPGYTPGRDPYQVPLAAFSGGEAVMRPEFTRAVGPGFVYAANAMARKRGVSGVRDFLTGGQYAHGGVIPGGNIVQRFDVGGILGAIGKASSFVVHGASNLLAAGASAFGKKILNPILGRIPGADSPWAQAILGLPKRMIEGFLGWLKKVIDPKLGGDAHGVVAVAKKYIGTGDDRGDNNNMFSRWWGMPGGPWCFASGTLVDTPDGLVPIEELRRGDLVVTASGNLRPVIATGDRLASETLIIRAAGGAGTRTTPEHPYLTPDGWVEAGKLRPGDLIDVAPTGRWADGHDWTPVEAIDPEDGVRVFNITVADEHTFIADGAAVHNCAMFVSYVIKEARAQKYYSGYPTALAAGYNSMRHVSSGQPGDLATYRGGAHINIIEKPAGGGGYWTIGGNQNALVQRGVRSPGLILRPSFAHGGIIGREAKRMFKTEAPRNADPHELNTPLVQLMRGLPVGQMGNVARAITRNHLTVTNAGLYDDGGLLHPGLSLVANATRRPERVLTDGQWQALTRSAQGGDRARQINLMPGATVQVTEGADVDMLADRLEFAARSAAF